MIIVDTLPATQPAADVKTDAPRTLDDAVARFGAPTLRQQLDGGGTRARWVRLRETLLAAMDVTTVDTAPNGQVLRFSQRTVSVRDPAAY